MNFKLLIISNCLRSSIARNFGQPLASFLKKKAAASIQEARKMRDKFSSLVNLAMSKNDLHDA